MQRYTQLSEKTASMSVYLCRSASFFLRLTRCHKRVETARHRVQRSRSLVAVVWSTAGAHLPPRSGALYGPFICTT
eukprot:3932785-Pleurochrysis_carterae.AAC.5